MKIRWMVAAVAAVGLATVTFPVITGCGSSASRSDGDSKAAPDASACSAKAAPANLEFTLTDMNGKAVRLADYKGKAVLLNFWATWCPPCKTEIPVFIELQEKYRARGFVVLGVSTDDPADALRAFAAEHKMNYPVLQATEELMDAYGPIWAIPVSILINRDGTICKKHMGPATKEEFEKDIKAVL